MLEHPDDREGHTVEKDRLTNRDHFLPGLLRRTPQFVAGGSADHTHAAGHFIIDLIEHAAVFDDVLSHLQGYRPCSHAIPSTKPLSVRRGNRGDTHLGREFGDQGRAVLKREHILYREAGRLVRQVPLLNRQLLGFDSDLVESADGDERLARSLLHARHQGRHGHQAGDSQDDAQHREQGPKLVGPNLTHPGQHSDPELCA